MNDTASRGPSAQLPTAKSWSGSAPKIVRVLMGLVFIVFGLNGFLNFMPPPPDMPEEIVDVVGALAKAGFLPVAMGTQLLVGVLLLANLFVPLALALIAPVLVGILAFHIALEPASIGPGVVLTLMELYLAWVYRGSFRAMLVVRGRPGAGT